MIMEIRIYGLVDPRDNKIRYVGKTKRQLNKRLYEHIFNKRTIRTYKSNWITALKKENLNPLIIELEICDENNWIEREQYWINKLDNLTNLTRGGEDGTFTDEVIKHLSEQAKKRWESPEYRKKQLESSKKLWQNPDHRKKQLIAFGKAKWERSDDFKKKMSSIKKEQCNDENYINRLRLRSKSLWENPEFRKKHLDSHRTDEFRKTISKIHKNRKNTIESKNRISMSCKNKKPILVEGVIYESIAEGSRLIPMKIGKLKVRIRSKNFPEYSYK